MAGRFFNPFPQFFNSTPTAYVSGILRFYATGSSTPLSVYSNKALSLGAATSITLNSAGRPDVDIFLQDQDYKVTLEDSSGNIIWTADPVSARDSSYIVKTLTGSGSPNGTTAGTAGSASILPDFYWDYTNQILYICTTTGSSSTAVWTALNSSSTTAVVLPPQGYLTPTSGTPVITTGVTSGTAVYYTPYVGNLVPIYNGSIFVPFTFAELTLTLHSSHSASGIFDVFVFSNSGVTTLATGPAWSTATAGAGARGTGAGTTQLARVNGIWTNAVQITGRNGSTTYTISANQATYLGSIYIDSSSGQITCHRVYGQSRKWSVWNAYNRRPISLIAGDSTASWNYASSTVRQSRGQTGNKLTIFCGLAEELIFAEFKQVVSVNVATTGTTTGIRLGIGWDSTLINSGFRAETSATYAVAAGITVTTFETLVASNLGMPMIGITDVNSLEDTPSVSTGTAATLYGGSDHMMLQAMWNG